MLLVDERGMEAGLVEIERRGAEERRRTEAERLQAEAERLRAEAERRQENLHAAAAEGRLADLAAELRAKEAEGTLTAGTPSTQLPLPL